MPKINANIRVLIYVQIFLIFVGSNAFNGYKQSLEYQKRATSEHFVLVHGSCLGAWSWYKLIALLKSSGHKVTALDLAASGVSPRQPNELGSISEYFRPLTDLMTLLSSDSNERVILVGHSLGGLAISYAMQHFSQNIKVSVFLTAQMPGPALNVSTLSQEMLKRSGPVLDNKYTYDDGPDNPPTTFTFGPTFLSEYVFNLSPPEVITKINKSNSKSIFTRNKNMWDTMQDVALAETLIRPLRLFSMEDMSKVVVLTNDKYGLVPKVYIISEQDQFRDEEVERWMFEKNPPNRVEIIKGSDHMVMVSQPLQVWAHLHNIATTF